MFEPPRNGVLPSDGAHPVASPPLRQDKAAVQAESRGYRATPLVVLSDAIQQAHTETQTLRASGVFGIPEVVRVLGAFADVWAATPRDVTRALPSSLAQSKNALVGEILNIIAHQSEPISLTDACAVVTALAQLGRCSNPVLLKASRAIGDCKRQMATPELVQALRGFSRLGFGDRGLMREVQDRMSRSTAPVDPSDLAAVASIWANLGERDVPFLVGLAKDAAKRISSFKPGELCELLSAYSRLDLRVSELLGSLRQLQLSDLRGYSTRQLVWLADSCASLGVKTGEHTRRDFFEALTGRIGPKIGKLNPTELCQIMGASAKLRVNAGWLLNAITPQVLSSRHQLSPHALAPLLSGAAALSPQTPLCHELRDKVILFASSDRFSPKQLVEIGSAYAKHQPPDREVLKAVADSAVRGFAQFGSHERASLARSLVKTGGRYPEFAKHVATLSHVEMSQASSRDVVGMVWAYAKLSAKEQERNEDQQKIAHDFVAHVVERLSHDLHELNGVQLSNLSSALGSLNCAPRKFLARLGDEVINRLQGRDGSAHGDEFSPQSVSMILWAFAKLGQNHHDLFRAGAVDVVQRTDQYKLRELSSVAWACATIKYRDVELFSAIAEQMVRGRPGQPLNRQDLSNTAWAFATLNVQHEDLLQYITRLARDESAELQLEPRDRANIAWSLAILNPSLVRHVCSAQDLAGFPYPPQWRQVYHALLVAGLISPQESHPRLEAAMSFHDEHPPQSFERMLYADLQTELDLSSEELELQVWVAGCECDIRIGKVLIECDGDQFHRSWGPDGDVALGPDVIQDEIASQFGYRVVHVRDSEYFGGDKSAVLERVRKAVRG